MVTLFQSLEAEQNRANKLQARLEVLEGKLSITDSALEQDGEQTREKLDFWESEIRKLWALSNDRNKGWIQDNQQAIKKLSADLGEVSKLGQQLQDIVGRFEQSFGEQELIKDELATVQLTSQAVARNLRDLSDQVNSTEDKLNQASASLARRVKDNEEAVASMDQYRLTVNRRLNDLQQQSGLKRDSDDTSSNSSIYIQ